VSEQIKTRKNLVQALQLCWWTKLPAPEGRRQFEEKGERELWLFGDGVFLKPASQT